MPFAVKQKKFEGPLDLLLDLIEREKLSINDISLARVTQDFLEALKKMPGTDKEELAEFLVIAAQLILIKSRTLLPQLALSNEEEYSIEELEQRLADYKKIKELTKDVKKMLGEKRFIYSREWMTGMGAMFYPPPHVTPEILQGMFEAAITAIPKLEKLQEEKIQRIVSLEDRMRELQKTLEEKVERVFSEIIAHSKDKAEVIVSFLAILELAKQKFLQLKQEVLFGEITMKKDAEQGAAEDLSHAGKTLFGNDTSEPSA